MRRGACKRLGSHVEAGHHAEQARRTRPARPWLRRKPSGRVILVSNRLPISVRVEHGELVVERSSGGLATGLSGYHDRGRSVWIGWPGESWRLTATSARP